MPSKSESCEILVDLIETKGQNKIIYIAADCYGQEDLLISIFERYHEKILLNINHQGLSNRTKEIWKNWLTKVECLRSIVTDDVSCFSRFRACAANGKGIRQELRVDALNIFALSKREAETSLFIRASTLWFGCKDRFEDQDHGERLDHFNFQIKIVPMTFVLRTKMSPRAEFSNVKIDRRGVWHILYSMHSS
jgi:hypothetical protein